MTETTELPTPTLTFSSPYLKGVRFELRPRTVEPSADCATAMLYRREGGNYTKAGVGAFRDGDWWKDGSQRLDGDLFWVRMVIE